MVVIIESIVVPACHQDFVTALYATIRRRLAINLHKAQSSTSIDLKTLMEMRDLCGNPITANFRGSGINLKMCDHMF